MSKSKKSTVDVQGTTVSIVSSGNDDFISLTDMLKAKDGEFFISDWLRNRNTVEFLGIWESVFNPAFNYGEFAIIKSKAGLNSYKISVKEWVEKTNAIGSRPRQDVMVAPMPTPTLPSNSACGSAGVQNISGQGVSPSQG